MSKYDKNGWTGTKNPGKLNTSMWGASKQKKVTSSPKISSPKATSNINTTNQSVAAWKKKVSCGSKSSYGAESPSNTNVHSWKKKGSTTSTKSPSSGKSPTSIYGAKSPSWEKTVSSATTPKNTSNPTSPTNNNANSRIAILKKQLGGSSPTGIGGGFAALRAKLGGGVLIIGGMKPGAFNPVEKIKLEKAQTHPELDNTAAMEKAVMTQTKSTKKRKPKKKVALNLNELEDDITIDSNSKKHKNDPIAKFNTSAVTSPNSKSNKLFSNKSDNLKPSKIGKWFKKDKKKAKDKGVVNNNRNENAFYFNKEQEQIYKNLLINNKPQNQNKSKPQTTNPNTTLLQNKLHNNDNSNNWIPGPPSNAIPRSNVPGPPSNIPGPPPSNQISGSPNPVSSPYQQHSPGPQPSNNTDYNDSIPGPPALPGPLSGPNSSQSQPNNEEDKEPIAVNKKSLQDTKLLMEKLEKDLIMIKRLNNELLVGLQKLNQNITSNKINDEDIKKKQKDLASQYNVICTQHQEHLKRMLLASNEVWNE